MKFRNIHFSAPAAEIPEAEPAPAAPAAVVAIGDKLRIKRVSVSPREEYLLRDGEARPISDALASVILSKSGKVEITAKGVVVDRKNDLGHKRHYWHPDSPLCNDLSQRSRKVVYLVNPLRPQVVHLLDAETGIYLESLPEISMPGVLDTVAQGEALADVKRQQRRVARHLQRLHGDDTAAAIEAATGNLEIMQRVVQTLPAAPAAVTTETATGTQAERIQQAETDVANDRQTYGSMPDRLPAVRGRKAPAAPKPETSSEILLRRDRKQTECPY